MWRLLQLLLFFGLFGSIVSTAYRVHNQRQLTFGETALFPKLSPDGKNVAYVAAGSDTTHQLYRVSVSRPYDRPQRMSTGLGRNQFLKFEQDGSFCYVSDVFQFPSLKEAFEAALSKSGTSYPLELLTANPLGNLIQRSNWTLSKTGLHLAAGNPDQIVSFPLDPAEKQSILLVNSSTGAAKELLSFPDGTFEAGATISSDGSKIAFARKLGDRNSVSYELYIASMDGQSTRLLQNDQRMFAVAFTSDGSHLVISQWTDDLDENCFFATIGLDGSDFRWVLMNGQKVKGITGSFSVDGSKFVFTKIERLPQHKRKNVRSDVYIVDWEAVEPPTWKRLFNKIFNPYLQATQAYFSATEENGMRSMSEKASPILHSDVPGPVFPEERHLKNVRQLTFGGQNAEGYFAFHHESIVLQAAGQNNYGTVCDQIYRLDYGNPSDPVLQRLSTGLGSCTCSYFLPDDRHAIYASTFLDADGGKVNVPGGTCAEKKCQSEQARTDPVLKELCNTSYTWDLHPGYDIFLVDERGDFLRQLTETPGYDAEGAISPDGRRMVFTSMRTGDPELWLFDFDSGRFTQLTKDLGYDGGPFFSPDGTKIGFRASRPKTVADIRKYKQLLSYNLVEPLAMELFVVNVDGTGLRQVTALGNSSWAPFFLNDNRRIVFSSNFGAQHFGTFNLYVINEDGTGLEQVTYSGGFDAFPMPSPDGRQLIWGSTRNAAARTDLNLFLADWVD